MIREGVRGAATVLPYHSGNVVVGEAQPRIRRFEARVIPGFDFAEKDVSIHVPREFQLTPQALQVIGQDNTPGDRGEQLHPACDCRHFFITHGRVTGAKIHRTSEEALGPLATADGVIAYLHAGMLFVIFLQPFFVERRREGGAGTVELERASGSTLFRVVRTGKHTATDDQNHQQEGVVNA